MAYISLLCMHAYESESWSKGDNDVNVRRHVAFSRIHFPCFDRGVRYRTRSPAMQGAQVVIPYPPYKARTDSASATPFHAPPLHGELAICTVTFEVAGGSRLRSYRSCVS